MAQSQSRRLSRGKAAFSFASTTGYTKARRMVASARSVASTEMMQMLRVDGKLLRIQPTAVFKQSDRAEHYRRVDRPCVTDKD